MASVAEGRRTVLITGCSPGGIGHSLCHEFHSKGLHVIATARDVSVLSDLKALGMTTLSLDVTVQSSIDAAAASVAQLTGGSSGGGGGGRGRLDILVNNAGRNLTVPATDVPIDEARLMLATNLLGAIAVTQTLVPLLLGAAEPVVVNIGSVAGHMPYVYGAPYNASKAALHAYTSTLRVELAPFGVRVLLVVTGGVSSNIARTPRRLPPASLYAPVEAEYQARLRHSQVGAMPRAEYARAVVAEVLGAPTAAAGPGRGGRRRCWGLLPPRKELWCGNKAWLVWLGVTFLGSGFLEWVFRNLFGLGKLRGLVKERRAEADAAAAAAASKKLL